MLIVEAILDSMWNFYTILKTDIVMHKITFSGLTGVDFNPKYYHKCMHVIKFTLCTSSNACITNI